jgi:hypothetical protein
MNVSKDPAGIAVGSVTTGGPKAKSASWRSKTVRLETDIVSRNTVVNRRQPVMLGRRH